jgi:hypothetical protein
VNPGGLRAGLPYSLCYFKHVCLIRVNVPHGCLDPRVPLAGLEHSGSLKRGVLMQTKVGGKTMIRRSELEKLILRGRVRPRGIGTRPDEPLVVPLLAGGEDRLNNEAQICQPGPRRKSNWKQNRSYHRIRPHASIGTNATSRAFSARIRNFGPPRPERITAGLRSRLSTSNTTSTSASSHEMT